MRFGAALHRLALRAYPLAFRTRLGDDLQETFRRRVAAARQRGVVHGVISLLAGLMDTCVSGLAERPGACVFAPRCAFANELCRSVEPAHADASLGRALCHTPLVAGVPTVRSRQAA